MSLCSLCKGIPWEDLPSVPKDLPGGLSGYDYIQALYQWPEDLRGYPHHQGLDALGQSATSCDLCRQIYRSADNVQKQLESLKPKWEAGETRVYNWPKWDLFLVKRRDGGDGCWIMSFVEGGDRRKKDGFEEAWIVAALGLCVKDGRRHPFLTRQAPIESSLLTFHSRRYSRFRHSWETS